MMMPNFTISLISITVLSSMICHRRRHHSYVLGSGGHTAEMLNLVTVLRKDRFAPRVYVAAKTDNMSLQKARVLEDSLVDQVAYVECLVILLKRFGVVDRCREGKHGSSVHAYLSKQGSRSIIFNFSYDNANCYRACSVANDENQTSSDLMQWAWDLFPPLLNRIPL